MGRSSIKHTEFGNIVRQYINRNDISQEELAKQLGILPSKLSNYLSGKTIPEMDFIGKCIEYFKLEKDQIKEIFAVYFSSIAKNNGKIVLDMDFFQPHRIEMLVEVLIVLLLYPYDKANINPEKIHLEDIMRKIESSLDSNVRYTPPSKIMVRSEEKNAV